MYDDQILNAHGKAKKEDLDRIEQRFHVKIPTEVREPSFLVGRSPTGWSWRGMMN